MAGYLYSEAVDRQWIGLTVLRRYRPLIPDCGATIEPESSDLPRILGKGEALIPAPTPSQSIGVAAARQTVGRRHSTRPLSPISAKKSSPAFDGGMLDYIAGLRLSATGSRRLRCLYRR